MPFTVAFVEWCPPATTLLLGWINATRSTPPPPPPPVKAVLLGWGDADVVLAQCSPCLLCFCFLFCFILSGRLKKIERKLNPFPPFRTCTHASCVNFSLFRQHFFLVNRVTFSHIKPLRKKKHSPKGIRRYIRMGMGWVLMGTGWVGIINQVCKRGRVCTNLKSGVDSIPRCPWIQGSCGYSYEHPRVPYIFEHGGIVLYAHINNVPLRPDIQGPLGYDS